MGLARKIFWGSVAGLVHTHVTYPLSLAALERLRGRRTVPPVPAELPAVSLIVAAHDEEDVIDRRVQNALALDYPRERLELIVSSDGSTDATVERARAAGADVVLDLPRGGKIRAQDAAVERARGEQGAGCAAPEGAGGHRGAGLLRPLVVDAREQQRHHRRPLGGAGRHVLHRPGPRRPADTGSRFS